MNSVQLACEVRERLGSKTAGAARKEGKVPVVIYGNNSNYHVFVEEKALAKIVSTPGQKTIVLNVGSKSVTTIVKDIQYHPVSDVILHADFIELVPGKIVITEIPVQTVGRAKGVAAGGKLATKLRSVRVKVTPENLVAFLECDVTNIELGKSFRISDLLKQIDGKMEVLHAPSIPVAAVLIPRALRSAQTKGG